MNAAASARSGVSRTGRILLRVVGLAALLAALGLLVFLLSRPEVAAPGRAWARYGLRAGLVALALLGWFWSQALIASRGLHADAIHDLIHDLSAPLHRYLEATPRAAQALLIVSSAFIDLFGVFLIAAGIFGPSLRPVVALLILFALRQLCQALCALPTPPGMIWRHPGFPSLLVTYGVGNDFFFSGHTAVATLGAIEVARMGPWWLGAAAAAVALAEVATVLTLRAHYTMDILAALAATWCAVSLAERLCACL
jgi:hypothetical protein